jgi:hypothetical protein
MPKSLFISIHYAPLQYGIRKQCLHPGLMDEKY